MATNHSNKPPEARSADQAIRRVLEAEGESRAAINACHQARQQAANATESAIDATAATAHFLSREVGLGTRDIGELLGISHQRVAQLLADDAA